MAVSAAPTTTYWFDGALTSEDAIRISPFAHALHYGSGVFEGVRSYALADGGVAIFRLREHLERLFASAEHYGLAIPYSLDELVTATVDAVRASGQAGTYIRPLVFFGDKVFHLNPRGQCPTHVMIAVRPFSGSVAPGGEAGCRCTISPIMKTPSKALPATVKANGHYTNSILALQDATARGFDEALLLNDKGDIAEGTGENIFAIKNGTLFTNDPSADVLDGITRRTVLELARSLGIPTVIEPLSVAVIRDADEVFLTGTAAEIVPVRCVDDREYGAERPITTRLREAYAKAVRGEDAAHRAWLTPVT